MDFNPFRSGRATQETVQEQADDDTVRMMKANPNMMKKGGPGGLKGLNKKAQKDVKKAMKDDVNESKFVIPEEIPANERTAFHGAAAAAAKAGKKSFNFGGKTHPVTMAKDTAHKIADQKEGYYKDQEIRRQDREMGAKPVPAKKRKDAKGAGKEGDVEMNPKMDTAKKEGASKIRESLLAVLSEKDDRKKHNPNEDKAEKMKDNRKGKGAEDMMADADKEVEKGPDAHLNEPEINKDNFKKMTSNVNPAKKRNRDNAQGDMKIVPGGTQFKDPATMKAEGVYNNMKALTDAYASIYAENVEEESVEESYTHEFDYAEDGKHTAKKFVATAKKAGIKAKIHDPRGPGGGHPVVHLGHKDDDHMHKFLKKHYNPDMEKGDLKYHKI